MSLSPSALHDTFTTDLDSTYLEVPTTSSPFNPPSTPANFASPQTSSSDSMQSTPAMRPAFPAAPTQQYLHQRPVQMNNNVGFNAPFGLGPVEDNMPPFFFPEQQMIRQHIATQQLRPQHAQQERKMYYAGVHQQMHMAKQQPTTQHADAAKNAKVDAVINQLKFPASLIKPASTSPVLPHIGRSKKEEDEMDEDERLLASEEGKKLSSKERRQLRNKVSARAFRSRRKEYISQLEAEVNSKNAENAALQTENERLRTENTRLESLSRMLLASPAFSQFLDDLSENRTAITPQQHRSLVPQPPVSQAVKQPEQPWYQTWNPPSYTLPTTLPPAATTTLEEPLLEMDEDYTVCDGFFATLRDEKADFTLPPNTAPHNATVESEQYSQDNLLDLINLPEDQQEDGEKTPRASQPGQRKDLDELFPGVGVNGLLERLEKVAGGEPVERYFDVAGMRDGAQQQQVQGQGVEQNMGPHGQNAVGNSGGENTQQQEGVGLDMRRVGLVVQ